jgi:hypothetical protein
MIALTTNGSGAANDDSTTIVKAGQRYVFLWGDDVTDGPTTGTLTPTLECTPGQTTTIASFHKPDQTAISYDLSAVNSGSFEFVPATDGIFHVNITGGGISKIIHFAVTPITP